MRVGPRSFQLEAEADAWSKLTHAVSLVLHMA